MDVRERSLLYLAIFHAYQSDLHNRWELLGTAFDTEDDLAIYVIVVPIKDTCCLVGCYKTFFNMQLSL